MLCKSPFIRDPTGNCFKSLNKEDWLKGVPFPCGQCLPCRINKRRVWSTRLWLETMSHADNMPMIFLSYDEDHVPRAEDGSLTLSKRDIQLYVKRLRKAGYKFRYYIAGEYGPQTHRPHYHALFFGVSHLFAADFCSIWPNGFASAGYDTSQDAIQYVAGYVTKKIIIRDKNDPRVPEFALMSRRPAIGSLALKFIVDVFKRNPEIISAVLSNPSLKVNGRYSPLGRTLSDHLRSMLGFDYSCDSFISEMRKLWKDSVDHYDPNCDDLLQGPLVQALLKESAQRNVQIEKRFSIFNSRSSC